jgi:hypothetical protein
MTIGEHEIDLMSLRCANCLTELSYFAGRKPHRSLPCIPQVRARNEVRIKHQSARLHYEMETARKSAELRMQLARDITAMTPNQRLALDAFLA